jgi:ComEC/Rec2-related protein
VAIAGLGLVFLLRRHAAWCEAALVLTALAAGFALMRETAFEHQAPMLQRHVGPVALTGRVVDIDLVEKGWRAVIETDPLPGVDASEQPRRLRVHIPPKSDELTPGDRVNLKAMLYPVPIQVLPGGRDFQRELYFSDIGGVGYALGAREKSIPARRRAAGARRCGACAPGSTGGVASALITGKRGAISEDDKQAFRDSGLSHLLAIVSLHRGLVGAFVFFAVRGGLGLVPAVALSLPIKKIAAGVALLALTCYLLISGAAIPTERAFLMNGIAFAAIIIDRLRISMRICAIAAVAVLVMQPESLVGVSFQMSFGAVVALIAVYETFGERLGRVLHNRSILGQVLGYCGSVVLMTVIATIGTAPFSIYHFHHLALYSPLANVIAVPLSAMWTLPWGVVACLLMPFGLEQYALVPMGWDRRHDLDRASCLGAARQCLGDAAPAARGARRHRARRLMALPVARQLAVPRPCRHRRGLCHHGAHASARRGDRRRWSLRRRARQRWPLFRRRRQEREHRALALRLGNRRGIGGVAARERRRRTRARLRWRTLPLRGARTCSRDRHRQERAAGHQMPRGRRHRGPSAGRLPLPQLHAGHRPHRLIPSVAPSRCGSTRRVSRSKAPTKPRRSPLGPEAALQAAGRKRGHQAHSLTRPLTSAAHLRSLSPAVIQMTD